MYQNDLHYVQTRFRDLTQNMANKEPELVNGQYPSNRRGSQSSQEYMPEIIDEQLTTELLSEMRDYMSQQFQQTY